MRTVIIGPTGAHLRTVNVATGASGATGVWETVHYAVSGPSGSFETVQVASSRDTRFRSLAIPGFTGTVTPDPAPAGGGGAPDWVPADAKIYIDLIAPGRAWTETDGEVAIDTLLGTDANTSAGWATSLYDASNLTADGYVQPNNTIAVAFIGAALTKLMTGATIVSRTKEIPSGAVNSICPIVLLAANGNDAVETALATTGNHNFGADSYGGSFNTTISSIVNAGLGAINVAAITVTDTRFDAAINGSSAVAGVLASDDRPVGNPFVAAVIDSNNHHALQSITIYDALPSTAGLSELSRIIPTDAKIHINLVQDWAWTEADGEVAIDTLLGADANTVNWFGASAYDAGNLTATGYVSTTRVALIGAARTKTIGDATSVFRFCSTEANNFLVGTSSADGNSAIEFYKQNGTTASATAYQGSYSADINDIVNVSEGTPGVKNAIALTLTSDRAEYAVNGSVVNAAAITVAERPASLVTFVVDASGTAIQSITIYDALPSTAGLSALSETGVINTAPHSLTWTWWGSFAAPNTDTAEIPSTSVSAGDAPILQFTAYIDDEGNPVTWSVTEDDTPGGGQIAVLTNNYIGTKSDSEGLAPGVYHFTVRATDPGGLYVEQQFTITVTA